jgi:hypothetical protein
MTPPLPMTPARWVALAVGLPVAFALIGSTAFTAVAHASQVGYRVHVSAPASGGQTRVTIDNADARLRPGAGDRVSVSGTLRGSLSRPMFAWQSTASGLTLDSHCWAAWVASCSLGYDITAPTGLPLTVSDGSGDLNASGFGGRVTLSDGSGDLRASRLAGTISLSDGSGDITASGLDGGSVQLSDGSGDIRTSSLAGSGVRLSNGSGDIVITGLAATDVVGDDGSGSITLTFTKVPRRVDVTDESGDIKLVLPPGPTVYRVDAASTSGGASVSVKTSRSSPYVIIASDVSGNVTVTY